LSWETRREVLDRPKKDKGLDKMPIVIQARPKVAEWWQDCVNRGLVNFEGLGETIQNKKCQETVKTKIKFKLSKL
jgi:hypothetical protein